MIGLNIKYGDNSLSVSLPSDELYDHLMSIGINENISMCGNDKVKVERYTDNDIPVSQTVCDRLLHTDRISKVNELCERIESAWRVGYDNVEKTIAERNLHGAEEMSECVAELDIQSRQDIEMHNNLSM